jgi:hypothetical protein
MLISKEAGMLVVKNEWGKRSKTAESSNSHRIHHHRLRSAFSDGDVHCMYSMMYVEKVSKGMSK